MGYEMNEPVQLSWFLGTENAWEGPLSVEEVFERLATGQISWVNYLWKEGQRGWVRICDLDEFKDLVVEPPRESLISEIQHSMSSGTYEAKPDVVKATVRPALFPRKWFLYFNYSQFGPYSEIEVREVLHRSEISTRVYAWRDGMPEWEKLEKIPAFENVILLTQEGYRAIGRWSREVREGESRMNLRKPLVARIILSNDSSVGVAMCRDISVGGMQVLTDKLPGGVGTRIKLNVCPTDDDVIKPFVTEGVIVRILENGRGFSFRFDQLSNEAKSSIEKYINQ